MSVAPEIDVPMVRALDAFGGMELPELDDIAALQTRRDRKYLVDPRLLPEVLAAIEAPLRVLDIDGQRCFPYRSTYFDTPDLLSYHEAAHSRPRRFKVRSRTYLSTGTCWLEVKRRGIRGETIKDRIPHPPVAEAELTLLGRSFVARNGHVSVDVDELAPVLVTGYERATVFCGQRATLDAGLWCALPHGERVPLGVLGKLLVVETKSPGRAPGPLDRALWSLGIRPSTISKYAIGMATAHADLRANKWHRVLARHVGGARTGVQR